VLSGFLPCGLVYVACAAATTTAGVTQAATYMAVFGLGTVPILFVMSTSGRLFPAGLRLKMRKAVPVAVVLLASLLILRGMALGIPYLSPDLSAAACHQ